MKILIDVNLSPRRVEVFSAAGLSAVHWSSIGPLDAADNEIVRYATEEDFVVFTHDLDFSAILAAGGAQKPSVVQVRGNDLSLARIGDLVVKAVIQTQADLAAGALVTVDTKRVRVRILPLIQ